MPTSALENDYPPELDTTWRERISFSKVGVLRDLFPGIDWNGPISVEGKNSLSENEWQIFESSIIEAATPIKPGSQRCCMDGRICPLDYSPGAKTAGGTLGDAGRLWVAGKAKAFDGVEAFDLLQSLKMIQDIDSIKQQLPGGHQAGQCGAVLFADGSVKVATDNQQLFGLFSKGFLGVLGKEFVSDAQNDVFASMGKISASSSLTEDMKLLAPKLTNYNPQLTPVY